MVITFKQYIQLIIIAVIITVIDCNVLLQTCNKDLRRFCRSALQSCLIGRDPGSTNHYTRPGTCINCPLHQAWIQYLATYPKLISYPMPSKLACCLPQKQLQNYGSGISDPPPKYSKNLCCNSGKDLAISLAKNTKRCEYTVDLQKHIILSEHFFLTKQDMNRETVLFWTDSWQNAEMQTEFYKKKKFESQEQASSNFSYPWIINY